MPMAPEPPKAPSRTKRAAATVAVGTSLVGAGGEIRHRAVRAAENSTRKHKLVAARSLLHRGAKGRNRYLLASALGAVGGAGMGYGAHELVYPPKETKAAFDDSSQRPKVDLQRHAADFVRQGIAGNADAFSQKIDNARQNVPKKVRAQQVAASTAAGGAGSLIAHRVMDRRSMLRGGKQVHGRHAAAAIAGTSAIIGSLPLTSKLVHRQGYEMTPTGVRRRKTPPVRPTRSQVVETRPDRSGRSYSQGSLVKRDIEKAEKKVHLAVGRSGRPACGTGPRPTTDTVTASRHTAKVNCAACLRTHQARSLMAVGKLEVPRFAKAATATTGLSQAEQRRQLKRKRRNLGFGVVGSTIGATGVGLLAAREVGPHLPKVGAKMAHAAPKLERAGLATALAGGGIGSVQGIQGARIQHKDLKGQALVLGVDDKQTKSAALVSTARMFTEAAVDGSAGGPPAGAPGSHGAPRAPGLRASNIAARRTRNGVTVPVRRANTVSKIETSMDEDKAKKITARHGLKGPLPKDMPREKRMRTYEARYVAAGGPKGEKWKHRADNSDHVTGGMLAIGGSAGLTELATKTPRVSAALARRGHNAEHVASRSGRVGIAAGTAAAGSELFHRHAQHKQASYASSPAGVAASALRRMRDYTP